MNWSVPVSEVSTLATTQDARADYTRHKAAQRPLLDPALRPEHGPADEGGTAGPNGRKQP